MNQFLESNTELFLYVAAIMASVAGRRKCNLDELDLDLHEVDSQLKDLEYLEDNLALEQEIDKEVEEQTVIYEYDEHLCEYVRLPKIPQEPLQPPPPAAAPADSLLYSPATERDQKRGYTTTKDGAVTLQVCITCNFRCKRQNVMKDHVNEVHLRVPLPCTDCDYVTFKWKALWGHRYKQHGLGAMRCPSCPNFRGVTRFQMEDHVFESHPGMDLSSSRFEADILKPEVFRKRQGLEQHDKETPSLLVKRRAGHFSEHYFVTDSADGKRQYNCKVCPFVGKTNGVVTDHVNSKHLFVDYQCGFCDFSTKYMATLQTHNRDKHKSQKKECLLPDCTFSASCENTFQRHLLKKHNAVYDEVEHSIKIIPKE